MPTDRQCDNAILAGLPATVWERIQPVLTTVTLRQRQILTTPGERFRTIHFPLTALVSAVSILRDGSTAEMAAVGREGLVEMGILLGSEVALSRQIVQIAGTALQLPYEQFLRFRRDSPEFADTLTRFVQARYLGLLHAAACNARHTAEQRAARWLLLCQDRTGRMGFHLTQEFLAQMLGVSRGQVNLVLRGLQAKGLVQSRHGSLSITDRGGLESTTCECYRIIRELFSSYGLGF